MSSDQTTSENPDPESILPLLAVSKRDIPDRMLVVGDPARAQAAASLLEDADELGRNREYVMYRGRYNGAPLGIASHGVGASGATICFEELCQAGVRRIIRAGTAGGMQERVRDGDVVVVSGAVRDDGVTPRIVPLGYPAVPNLDVVADLRSAASRRGVDTHEGIVLTSDLFYPHPVLGSDLPLWQRAGVVAVEMECAALFVVSCQHGVESGAILAIDGNPLAQGDEDMTGYDPRRDVVRRTVDAVIRVALDALAPGSAE